MQVLNLHYIDVPWTAFNSDGTPDAAVIASQTDADLKNINIV